MKTLTVGSREVPVSLRAWDAELRRASSLAVIGVAAALVLAGVALQAFAPGATGALTALVVLMAAVVLFEGAVIATGVLREREAPGAARGGGGEVLTLQCSECATQFDIHDDGTRPLYHACPGCGAEGVLGEEAEDAYAGASAAGTAGASATGGGAGGEHTHAHPATAQAAAAKPLRKLKLRCPGCETIFVVEDFGERPIRTECPGCGRRGELK